MAQKFLLAFHLVLSFLVNEGVIYRAENQITLKATEEAQVGKEYLFEGKMYLIVDDSLLRELVKTEVNFSNVITTKVQDMSFLFYKSELVDPQIQSWDVSNVKSLSVMFGLAEKINPDVSYWDTRSVIDFSDMFHGTKQFQGDISRWNTSSGQFFNGMFYDSNFNGYINDWDISSGKNLGGMFDDAKLFNQPLDKWNTSGVEYMGGMFAEAIAFNQNITNWDVRKVNNMTNMFRYAINFKQDLSGWEVPLIKVAPEDFSTKSPVISPVWNRMDGEGSTWYYWLGLLLVLPPLLIFYKRKVKNDESALIPEVKPVSTVHEEFKSYLKQKNTNQISKFELDEILGTSKKSVETQKKVRSTFIKEFNDSGLGEISRVRDNFDSRSYTYEVKWKE